MRLGVVRCRKCRFGAPAPWQTLCSMLEKGWRGMDMEMPCPVCGEKAMRLEVEEDGCMSVEDAE